MVKGYLTKEGFVVIDSDGEKEMAKLLEDQYVVVHITRVLEV